MNRIIKKQELVDELAKRTNFYKKNMREVVEALADIIEENFMTATFEEPSEIHLMPGIVIGGRRTPERESIDPRNRETIVTPEKVVPYAVFKPSFRKKLYVQRKKGKRR